MDSKIFVDPRINYATNMSLNQVAALARDKMEQIRKQRSELSEYSQMLDKGYESDIEKLNTLMIRKPDLGLSLANIDETKRRITDEYKKSDANINSELSRMKREMDELRHDAKQLINANNQFATEYENVLDDAGPLYDKITRNKKSSRRGLEKTKKSLERERNASLVKVPQGDRRRRDKLEKTIGEYQSQQDNARQSFEARQREQSRNTPIPMGVRPGIKLPTPKKSQIPQISLDPGSLYLSEQEARNIRDTIEQEKHEKNVADIPVYRGVPERSKYEAVEAFNRSQEKQRLRDVSQAPVTDMVRQIDPLVTDLNFHRDILDDAYEIPVMNHDDDNIVFRNSKGQVMDLDTPEDSFSDIDSSAFDDAHEDDFVFVPEGLSRTEKLQMGTKKKFNDFATWVYDNYGIDLRGNERYVMNKKKDKGVVSKLTDYIGDKVGDIKQYLKALRDGSSDDWVLLDEDYVGDENNDLVFDIDDGGLRKVPKTSWLSGLNQRAVQWFKDLTGKMPSSKDELADTVSSALGQYKSKQDSSWIERMKNYVSGASGFLAPMWKSALTLIKNHGPDIAKALIVAALMALGTYAAKKAYNYIFNTESTKPELIHRHILPEDKMSKVDVNLFVELLKKPVDPAEDHSLYVKNKIDTLLQAKIEYAWDWEGYERNRLAPSIRYGY